MFELIVLIIGLGILVYVLTQTDIPERIMQTFDPERIKESARMAMMGIKTPEGSPSITDPYGAERKELPISTPNVMSKTDVESPMTPLPSLWIDPNLPQRVENPELGDTAISDMPLIYPYRRRR